MAIAFDAASDSGYQTATASYNWSHVVVAESEISVAVALPSISGNSVSSITIDGSNLALVRAQTSGSGVVRVEIWKLEAPFAAGSHTIAVTLDSAIDSAAAAISLTGVYVGDPSHTEGDAGASATNVGAADATVSVTTSFDNDWTITAVATSDTAISGGGSETEAANVSGTLGSLGMSYRGPITPAGGVSSTWTNVGALQTWAIVSVGYIPTQPATKLSFATYAPIANTSAGVTINDASLSGVAVQSEDDRGQVPVFGTSNSVTVAIGTNPSGGTLSGTLTHNLSDGTWFFSDLSINNAGTGYTLTAAASGLTGATSGSFNITASTAAVGSTLCLMGVG